jgi:hypothetical protein
LTTLALADRPMLAPILDYALVLGAVEAGKVAKLHKALEERDALKRFASRAECWIILEPRSRYRQAGEEPSPGFGRAHSPACGWLAGGPKNGGPAVAGPPFRSSAAIV